MVWWLTLTMALLLAGTFLGVSLYQEHERIEKRERDRLATQVKVIEDNLVHQLDAANRALRSIRDDLPLGKAGSDRPLVNRRLTAMAEAIPGILAFVITDTHGIIIASNRDSLVGQDIHHREYFQAPLKNPDASTLYLSPPFRTLLGNFVVNVGLMIPQQKGGGVISAALDPGYFKTLLGSALYTPDMWGALAHGDGKLFLLVPTHPKAAGMDLAASGSLFSRHRASGRTANVFAGTFPTRGARCLLALRTIKPVNLPMDKPLVVVLGRDMSVLYDDWHREARETVTLFGVLALMALLALFLFERRQKRFDVVSARYEAAQRDNAERLKLATEASGVGVWDLNLETGRMTWDASLCVIYGRPPSGLSLSLEQWWDTLVPEDRPLAEKSFHAAIREDRPFDFNFRIRRGDGQVRTVRSLARVYRNKAGEAFRIIGIIEDVTERQQEQEALRTSERFLKTLTDVLPGMVGYWTRDLRCGYANQAYWSWFGKTKEQMLGISIQELMGEELFRKNEPYIQKALKGEAQRFQRTLVKPGGEVGYTWAHYIPDVDAGEVRGFYVLISDITELKQTQLQLESLNERLKQRTDEAEQASRSKSQFLATVTHEFRTPLSLLTTSTDILDRYAERLDPVKRAEQYELIRSAARQMSQLVDSVISFNGFESGGRRATTLLPLNIRELCRAIVAEVTAVWGAQRSFSMTVGDDCGIVLLDEFLFRRVLENVVSNAFRYTEPGGEVSVAVKREGHRLQVVTNDTGIGIPKEDQQKVFESFFRGRNVGARRGLGLGLAIVHEALEQLGGTLTLDSELGHGTKVRIEIPITDAQA